MKDYEKDGAAFEKYTKISTRTLSLNNPEMSAIDSIKLFDKRILVLGGGAGRVPLNLSLYGNKVTSIEISRSLVEFCKSRYPKTKFGNVEFLVGDAKFMESVDGCYDAVFFPMNGIDLTRNI